MVEKDSIIAVIWASNNTKKYWYKVFKDLTNAWYKTIPINPNEEEKILNKKVFKEIADYHSKINIAIFVVPPEITENILQKIKKDNIQEVRLQPWAESAKAIKICKEKKIKCTHNACIMIERKK